ncbi:MAG: TolC family protein, partial [Gammaproteobacteria bacterium]|nr:TolC family protein [Gammaproteobacteria bacterium]
AEQNPRVSGRLGAVAYRREMGSYAPLEAELTLEVPLFGGERNKAQRAQAQSAVMLKSAELKAAELEVQQHLTQLWMELKDLKLRQESLKTQAAYRELNLDRSRALYEMEVNTDLGDSMVRISQQRLDEAELSYQAELTWAEIDALSGRLLQRK